MPEAFRSAVLVHGAGGGGWEWAIWSRVFAAAGLGTIAPDLRPAAGGLETTGLADYREQVAAWLTAAPRPCLLVGASLGGLLAASLADRADALVLVNPMPPAGQARETPWPALVPWGRRASLAGTRRAMPDADDLATLHAFRRWRDESGRVLADADRGLACPAPAGPVLVLASDDDTDVPPALSRALAERLGAAFWPLPGSHVGPLLGRQAAAVAAAVLTWLNAPGGAGGVQPQLGAPA